MRFAHLAVEGQSGVSGHSRTTCGAGGRMAWRGGPKGMSQSFHRHFSQAFQEPDPETGTQDTKERLGMLWQGAQSRSWGPGPAPKHLSHPSSPLMLPRPTVQVSQGKPWGAGSGTQPRQGLRWSLCGSSVGERKVAARTKAVTIPLCPTKRSGLGQPGPCGQPLGAVPEAEEALLFPYSSRPSPTEFPFLSS